MLLSCHSQGSVLGAALLLQIERPASARTALLTYGVPLARLYGRFFPAYFSREALTGWAGSCATPTATRPGGPRTARAASAPRGGGATCTGAATRSAGRCSSTGRRCGRRRAPTRTTSTGRCSTRCSPVAAGDPCSPPIRGHSNYFADPAFAWTADALQSGTLPRPAGARAVPGTGSRGGDGARGRA